MLSAPPLGRAISQPRVAGAVREALDRFIAAEHKIGGAGSAGVIADWPAALALRQLEERATLRAVDRHRGARSRRHRAFVVFAPISRSIWRCEESRGRRVRGGHARPGAAAGRPGPKPRRWILPMTALRVTPISAAIWLQVRPAPTKSRRSATRSGFQVAVVIEKASLETRGRCWAADRAKAAQRAPFRAQRSQKREFDATTRTAPRSPSRIRA